MVAFAFKNEIVPPWLDAAKGDLACAALLPANVFESQADGADERNPLRKSRQKKRHDKLATDDMQKLIGGEGRAAFDRIRDVKFRGYRYEEGKRAQQVNVAAVARAIRKAIEGAAPDEPDMWPGLRALENRVR